MAVTGYDRDATIRVWDLTTNTLGSTLSCRSEITGLACTVLDDRPTVATVGYDETVRLFDLITHAELAVFDTGGPLYREVCIGPAQEIIIGTGRDIVVLERGARRQT